MAFAIHAPFCSCFLFDSWASKRRREAVDNTNPPSSSCFNFENCISSLSFCFALSLRRSRWPSVVCFGEVFCFSPDFRFF